MSLPSRPQLSCVNAPSNGGVVVRQNDAPQADTIKSKRDRAILSTLLFHALRREELCKLKVRDFVY
jgi:integrase